jgi:hypothetical protein
MQSKLETKDEFTRAIKMVLFRSPVRFKTLKGYFYLSTIPMRLFLTHYGCKLGRLKKTTSFICDKKGNLLLYFH